MTARPGRLEVLEAFKANPDKFDLVITDMSMPNMSGDKLAVELIKIRPDIPILLCTGYSENMTDEKIKSLGIKGFWVDTAETGEEGLKKINSNRYSLILTDIKMPGISGDRILHYLKNGFDIFINLYELKPSSIAILPD